MTRRIAALVGVVLALVVAPDLDAYLKLGTPINGQLVSTTWSAQPIRYFVTNRGVATVSAQQLAGAVASAFSTWSGVPTATVSSQFAGFTDATPFVDDNMSVIGFISRPDLDRTLGATTFTLDTVTGAILESDIFINSAFDWSVSASGVSGRYDVQSIALHEIGHLLGLGHSALGETELLSSGARRVLGKRAVMFPVAYPAGSIQDRTLDPDDEAGITDLYGTPEAARTLGTISGRVTLNGTGVLGAHVTAMNSRTGDLIATFSLTAAGEFVVSGLPSGLYVVRVEPLDDASVSSFFDETTLVNVNFKPAYYSKLVAVPEGGSGGSIEVKVSPK